MIKSSLTDYVDLLPHKNEGRKGNKIKKITIHHMAGDLSVERCGEVLRNRGVSANYGVDNDGRIGLYVEEENRSWASASPWNDYQAITIEVANDEYEGNWHVSDTAIETTIRLCVDICRRYNFTLNYTGDKNGSLTRHNMFAQTLCPGPYLESKFPYIAAEVNRRLKGNSSSSPAPVKKPISEIAKEVIRGDWGNGSDRYNRLKSAGYNPDEVQAEVDRLLGHNKPAPTPTPSPAPSVSGFTVQVLVNDLRIRKGPGTNYAAAGFTGLGVFTITERSGDWGKLKSGAGWIYLGRTDWVKILTAPAASPSSTFKVEVLVNDLRIRKGPGTNYDAAGFTGYGVFTITEEKNGWGKLKSGAGWIYLENSRWVKKL